MVTVKDLLKRIPKEDYDKVLVITTPDGAWTNIETIKDNEATIELSMEVKSSPFTSDN